MSLANLWQIFHHGLVQNTAHKQAFCKVRVTYYLQFYFKHHSKLRSQKDWNLQQVFKLNKNPLMMVCLIFYKTDYSNDYYTQQ